MTTLNYCPDLLNRSKGTFLILGTQINPRKYHKNHENVQNSNVHSFSKQTKFKSKTSYRKSTKAHGHKLQSGIHPIFRIPSVSGSTDKRTIELNSIYAGFSLVITNFAWFIVFPVIF